MRSANASWRHLVFLFPPSGTADQPSRPDYYAARYRQRSGTYSVVDENQRNKCPSGNYVHIWGSKLHQRRAVAIRPDSRNAAVLHTTLAICGVFLGCTYSVKWNGLGVSLAAWMIICLFLITQLNFFSAKIQKSTGAPTNALGRGIFPLPQSLKIWHYPLYLIVLPFLVYSILWIPHVTMYEQHGFVEMQRQIFGYHANTVKETTHPYCSVWYTWPLLIRPIGYYFDSDRTSSNQAEHVFTDIHLLGNPLIFWLSALAILCLTLLWVRQLISYYKGQPVNDHFLLQTVLVAGFFANWLPWSMVSRCVFQYHYMPASLFAFMALAWFMSQLISTEHRLQKYAGIAVLVAIFCALLYWLPLQLGMSLHPDNFYDRIWLRSWI